MENDTSMGPFIVYGCCFFVATGIVYFIGEVMESIALSNEIKKQDIEFNKKIADIRSGKSDKTVHVRKKKELIVNSPTTNPASIALNTNPSIKEYRLPDGSKIAFDTTKVEFSEKSVII